MMKKAVVLGLKILLLTILMVASLAVSSAIVSIHTSQSESNSLILIFLYALINTGILTIFIVNARPRGIKLIGITFMIFWGIQFFMTQIETLYFNASVKMPIVDVLEVVISGALTAVIFSSLAVLILGKFKKKDASHHHESLFKGLISKSWLHILSLSVSYVIIYFLFGYFIAWQFPDLRYYYTGSKDILNIFQHLSNQFRTDPILPLFQLFRGLLWSGLSIIMIGSLGKVGLKTYMISGLLFGVLITNPLLLNNAYMPGYVRLGHSFELFTSMFAFGLLSVFMLRKKQDG